MKTWFGVILVVFLIVEFLLFVSTDFERNHLLDNKERLEKIIEKQRDMINIYSMENSYYRTLLERNDIDYD